MKMKNKNVRRNILFENRDFKDSDNNYKQEKAEKITSRSSSNQLE